MSNKYYVFVGWRQLMRFELVDLAPKRIWADNAQR